MKPRLTWSMPMYSIPMSRVEDMDRMTSKHVRRWQGGLDLSDMKKWSEADKKGRRKIILVPSEVRGSKEDQRKAKAISISTQRAWTKKDATTPWKVMCRIHSPKSHCRKDSCSEVYMTYFPSIWTSRVGTKLRVMTMRCASEDTH